jgi:hypothetical protein
MTNPTSNFGWQMPTPTDLVTDLPADFEVFGQAVDTSMADLKGGTTGQILSKATNADMDFTWITNDVGDITAITVSSPLTGGGTSGSVSVGILSGTTSNLGAVQLSDSTSSTSTTLAATANAVKTSYDLAAAAVPKSTVTTAGDVIYATGSSAVTRLGIGSTGNVLTVAGGVPTWAAPAGGGKVLQVVQGTTTTATTVTSGAYTDTTLTATITPTSATSKVMVVIAQYYKSTSAGSGSAYGFQIKALRGATQIGGAYFDYLSGLAGGTYNKFGMFNFSYLDSPATTSATTYKTQLRNEVGTVVAQIDSQMSTILLLEIGA